MPRLKSLIVTILLALASSLFATTYYRVTADKLNVRERGETSSPVLFQLSKGDIVEGVSYGEWIEVRQHSWTEKGYAHADYLEECQTEESGSLLNSFHIPWGSIFKWIIIALVAFYIIRYLLRSFYLKALIIAAIGSALALTILPILGGVLLKPIGLGPIGIIAGVIIGGGIAVGLITGARRESSVPYVDPDYDNDYDLPSSSSNFKSEAERRAELNEQRCNEQLRQREEEERREEWERRQREEEWERKERERRQQEEEKEEEERRRSEDYRREADNWRSKYEYYSNQANSALSQAQSYARDAEYAEAKARETNDYCDINAASGYRDNAEIYMRDYEEYRSKAEYAYDKWQEYQNKI